MTIRIDHDSLKETAQAVHIMNEGIKEKFPTWNDLYHEMLLMVSLYMADGHPTKFSTYGFVLSAYRFLNDETITIQAAVTPSLALLHALKNLPTG